MHWDEDGNPIAKSLKGHYVKCKRYKNKYGKIVKTVLDLKNRKILFKVKMDKYFRK